MLIVQITDCHVVEPGAMMADRVDSAAALRRVLAAIAMLEPRPDLLVATGDLVNDGRPEQYDHLQALLGDVDIPLVVVPGNHDDRTELRARFPGLPAGGPDEPIDHTVELGDLRLVFLDTQIPGAVGGHLTAAQCDWIDTVLTAEPDRPTIVFQHHPPFPSGIEFMDRHEFVGADAYERVVARHPQVEAISCGHLHRAIHRRFGGTVASTWPATSAQLALGIGSSAVRYSSEPAGFAVHHWEPAAGLRSHLQPVGEFDVWTPTWALDAV